MTSKRSNEKAKSTSMAHADVANGEAEDTNPTSDDPQPGFDEHGGSHATGARQANINKEDDPPA